jgi:hypothetical protein
VGLYLLEGVPVTVCAVATVSHSMWLRCALCARADAIFDVPAMHVLDVNEDEHGWLMLTVESD